MSTLLRDLIPIPEHVAKGDFVLSLTENAGNSQRTLEHYVVTPQLAEAYTNALRFIGSATAEGSSKAAYLDGSFGSGKSHFMAVLHLLLQGDPQALAIPELAPAVQATRAQLEGRSFGLVPLHMIGNGSMEQAILGGYVEHLQREDPTAELPAVYADGAILRDADTRRGELGDDAFLATLSGGASDGGWGDVAAWTAGRYDAARAAAGDDPERRALARAVVDRLIPGYAEAMRGNESGYVDLDSGLAEIARHAKQRGHDGLVLFLDELVLWLGTRMADSAFVAREGQKLVKLVEFARTRPIPIVAFIARQRDLREFIGADVRGSERTAFADALAHWENRFHRVPLENRNLPLIAERRVLKPVDAAAKAEIDAAFEATQRARPEVLRVLLTASGDSEAFRRTYPFAPAFMETLVAASASLQRERTALKIMLQLLVDRRDDLELGQIVSVGELYDVLASGQEPVSGDMKRLFEQAQALYARQLRPMLLQEHDLDEHAAETVPRSHGFRVDDRIVKTLLIAALVPDVEPLRDLTLSRLAAVNHGSLRSPIPGQEKAQLLTKLRKWAARVGQVKLGGDAQDPTVGLRLTSVDIDDILDRVDAADNDGARRRLVRDIVLGELGVRDENSLEEATDHQVTWRGTKRTAEVLFGNVRDESTLPDHLLEASGVRWRLVVDYPFDTAGHTPAEDLDRLERWRQAHGETRTVCWIPAFFSADVQRSLRRLVQVKHVLDGDRLDTLAAHLSAQDRAQARNLLDDHRSALHNEVLSAVRQAYGVEPATDKVDWAHRVEEHLQALTSGPALQVPANASLADALERLLRELLDRQYPDHPLFGTEVTLAKVRHVHEQVIQAVDAPNHRWPVPADRRTLVRDIAQALGLGTQHDEPFILSDDWRDRLDREVGKLRAAGTGRITVADLRRCIDQPQPRGLPREVENLLILVYAQQTKQELRQAGGPADAGIQRLDDTLELVQARLPEPAVWDEARDRAAAVLGIATPGTARTVGAVAQLGNQVTEKLRPLCDATVELSSLLEQRAVQLDLDPDAAQRVLEARAAHDLAAHALGAGGDAVNVLTALAETSLEGGPEHVAASLTSSGRVLAALRGSDWQTITTLVLPRAAHGEEPFVMLRERLRNAVAAPEFALSLPDELSAVHGEALELLRADEERKRRLEEERLRREREELDKRKEEERLRRVEEERLAGLRREEEERRRALHREEDLTPEAAIAQLRSLTESDPAGELLVNLEWRIRPDTEPPT